MNPYISVIIPVYNGGENFGRCLRALAASRYDRWECIVVDDGSTDVSAETARQFGAKVVESKRPKSGPAACRNLGAGVAQGNILFFLDADVLVKPGTLAQIANILADPSLAACFGSYDETPAAANFLSQYRNLLHHYMHQVSNPEAGTFWAGCGAIRRDVFWQLGGFDAQQYPRPSIEDIELGYRLKAAGYRIRLEKSLQVTHLKRWTAVSLLLTDIRDRALPWSKLILQTGAARNDLNLQTSQKISAGLVFAGIFTVFASPFYTPIFPLCCIFLLLLLNRDFYHFLYQRRGLLFTLLALPWHWFYFLYSSLAFIWCYLRARLQNRKSSI